MMDMEDGDWTEVAASSWPGVERDLDARSEIVDSSEISSSDLNLLTVIEDEADTRALVRRLQNQIEVLAALAHRPNSGLADRCATTVQSKVRMLACVRNLRHAKTAAKMVQKHVRGRGVRSVIGAMHGTARVLQARQRLRRRARAKQVERRESAARAVQRATRAHLNLLHAGPTKTKLAQRALRLRACLEEREARHAETVEKLVTAHQSMRERHDTAVKHASSLELVAQGYAEALEAERAARAAEVRGLEERVLTLEAEKAQAQEQASLLLAARLAMEEQLGEVSSTA